MTLTNSTGEDMVDYKLYGNSTQDGTPTPDDPIEVVSVGDKTRNLIDQSTFSTTVYKYDAGTQMTDELYRGSLDKFVVASGESITLSWTNMNSELSTPWMCIIVFDADGNYNGNEAGYISKSSSITYTNSNVADMYVAVSILAKNGSSYSGMDAWGDVHG